MSILDQSARAAGCGLYFMLQAVTRALRADRGMVLVPRSDLELQAIGVCGAHIPLGDMRLSMTQSAAGRAFTSGVTVNARSAFETEAHVDEPYDKGNGFRAAQILCCPVMSHHRTKIVGVVQVLNKNGGLTPFDAHDEARLFQYASLFGFIIDSYGLDSMGPAPYRNLNHGSLPETSVVDDILPADMHTIPTGRDIDAEVQSLHGLWKAAVVEINSFLLQASAKECEVKSLQSVIREHEASLADLKLRGFGEQTVGNSLEVESTMHQSMRIDDAALPGSPRRQTACSPRLPDLGKHALVTMDIQKALHKLRAQPRKPPSSASRKPPSRYGSK